MIGETMSQVLQLWNSSEAEEAEAEVLPCCGSKAWARGLVQRRPVEGEAELLAASDAVWWSLGERDWREAFDSHPQIGQRHAAGAVTGRSLAWSEREQSAAAVEDEGVASLLADGNGAYEARFGRTFIVFANGKSASDILAILNARMQNDASAELRETAEQQRLITRLRLRRWMGAE